MKEEQPVQAVENYAADVADVLEFESETEQGERQSSEPKIRQKSHWHSGNGQVSNQAMLVGTQQRVGESVPCEDGTSLPTNHQQGHHHRDVVGM